MSNCLYPDQHHHSVGPDLGPNCLQRLSADDKSLLSSKELMECRISRSFSYEIALYLLITFANSLDLDQA